MTYAFVCSSRCRCDTVKIHKKGGLVSLVSEYCDLCCYSCLSISLILREYLSKNVKGSLSLDHQTLNPTSNLITLRGLGLTAPR